MLWYRSKVQPGLTTTNTYCNVNSHFLYCNQLTAHREIADNSCLCCNCYEKIRTPLIRAQFETIESHFLTIGLNYLPKYCISCETPIVKQQSLKNCIPCNNKLAKFQFDLEELALTVEDCKDSEILLIRGRYY